MSRGGYHAHVIKSTTDKLEQMMNEQLSSDDNEPLLFHTGGRDWVMVVWHAHGSSSRAHGATA